MGKMQRTKGKVFERRIAAALRVFWPDAEIRRSSQAERAYEADVFARGAPVLERLWLELNDARAPQPLKKLVQAERDLATAPFNRSRYPVVVWHRIREHVEWVTTRLWVVDRLRYSPDCDASGNLVVTMQLPDFIDLLQGAA